MIRTLLTFAAAATLCVLLTGCTDESSIGSDGKPAAPRPAPATPQQAPDLPPGAESSQQSSGGTPGTRAPAGGGG